MKNKKEKANFTVIFRTGRSWEYDMVINTLKEKGIPYQNREEYSSGLRVATPLRATPGPGTWWAVLVPENYFNEAKTILSELPIEIKTDPDIWDFSSSKKVKRGWQIYVWIALGLSLLWAIFDIIKTLIK